MSYSKKTLSDLREYNERTESWLNFVEYDVYHAIRDIALVEDFPHDPRVVAGLTGLTLGQVMQAVRVLIAQGKLEARKAPPSFVMRREGEVKL